MVAVIAVAIVAAAVVANPFGGGGGRSSPTPTPTLTQSKGPDPATLAAQAGTLSQLGTDLQEQSDLYAKVVGDIKSKVGKNKQAVKDWGTERTSDLKAWEAAKRAVDERNARLPEATPGHYGDWVWNSELQQKVWDPNKYVPGSTPTPEPYPSEPEPPKKVHLSLEQERRSLAAIAAAIHDAADSVSALVVDDGLAEAKSRLITALDILGQRTGSAQSALGGAIEHTESGDVFDQGRLAELSTSGISAAVDAARQALHDALATLGLEPAPSTSVSPAPVSTEVSTP